MKKSLSIPSAMMLALILALTMALMSVYVERIGPELVQYSNLCDVANLSQCYKPALKGGFPVAYLFDAPGISVERQLSFGEDDLFVGAFTIDVAIYFVTAMLVVFIVSRRRRVTHVLCIDE